VHSNCYGIRYGKCYSEPNGGPNGESMASHWLSQTQTQTQTSTYFSALSHVCLWSPVVVTESEIVSYLPRTTTTLGIGEKR